jgi:multidrug efflux pump subunit AcrB
LPKGETTGAELLPAALLRQESSDVWIVLTALRRPYTFVVLAVIIAIFGVRAAISTPTDIFPNINIPVVSVVWTYNGLPPNDMSGRIIYFYERYLTAQVADIQHIESQSLSGYGVVKIFFQKNVDIAKALAQVTAASQTVLKLLPPGITPPYVLSYNASSVPILQLALSSKKLPQMQLFDLGQNFIRPQLATVAGAAVPSPYGGKVLQVQIDLDQESMQAHGVSADDVLNAVSAQNLILPAGDAKVGKSERGAQRQPGHAAKNQRSAGQEGQQHDHLHARRQLRA